MTEYLLFTLPILFLILLLLGYVSLRWLLRKDIERKKKNEAKTFLNFAFEKDAIWDKNKIKHLVKEYHQSIEKLIEENHYNDWSFCTPNVLKALKERENGRLTYFKFYLEEVSIVSVKDKLENSKDRVKVLLQGKKEDLRMLNEDVPHIPTHQELWTMIRTNTSWIISEIDDDVEDEEIENLTNTVEWID